MLSSDIGSIPSRSNIEAIVSGAQKTGTLLPLLGVPDTNYEIFKNQVVDGFIDKLNAGIDIPNYPQFRDMNDMFFDLITGKERQGDGYLAVKPLQSTSNPYIPELTVLKENMSHIRDKTEKEHVKIKLCITGPYTLASFFHSKTPNLYTELGECLKEIAKKAVYSSRYAEVSHVSIDEPVLGFMNDPLLDYGSEGRTTLLEAWENICGEITNRGASTSMHLHNTSESLFWEVENLNVLTSHVGDPIYTQESTKQRLEDTDKKLWASVAMTQYDDLISAYLAENQFQGNIPEEIGSIWTGIRQGTIDPSMYLESSEIMVRRLMTLLDYFGEDRIAYVGPECGLSSFPSYDIAVDYLQKIAKVANLKG